MAAPIKNPSVNASVPERQESPAGQGQPKVDVIALTTHDDLLLELGQCLEGTAASISPVETSALALAAAADSRHVQVLVIDSRDLAQLRAEVDLIHSRAPALTALVFAPEDVEAEAATALKGSSVFAVLPLPIDPRKTAALFEGAVADAEARRSAARAADAASRATAAVREPRPAAGRAKKAFNDGGAATATPQPAPRPESTGGDRFKRLAPAGVAGLVVAVAVAWFLTRGEAPPPPAVAPQVPVDAQPAPVDPPVTAIPTVQGNVDELLEKARIAMRERRFTEPTSNSALLYYRSAAEADPGNPEALDGLSRMRPLIIDRFDELAKAARHDEAAVALAQLQSALPGDPAIDEMRLRLAAARIAKAIDDGDAERATALVRSAQAIGTVPATQLARWRAEIARLQEKAEQQKQAEAKARDAAAAEQKAREARAAAAAREAQLAREREAAQKLEAQRAEQAALAAAQAAQTEAAAGASAGQRVEPRLKRNARPVYPPAALDKGLTGVVTVVYTVDVEGKTQDVRVASSDPPGVFDDAATNAVRRWRYEPATVDGVPVEADLRVAIRFTQPK